MVLSSQTTMGMARHHDQTDVAACRKNLAGAAATGAGGCNSLLLPNPYKRLKMLGDTDTGRVVTRATRPQRNDGMGRWERCNFPPAGGRQHAGNSMSSNSVMSGDDRHAKGAVVLHGATWADRRIAQASHVREYRGFRVFNLRVEDERGQNLSDSSGPSRDVDNRDEGKPRVRNICGAKGGISTDCTANRPWLLIGRHLHFGGRKLWLTWEAPGNSSPSFFRDWRPGVGAAESRFKQVKMRLRIEPCRLVHPGRKLPSVKGHAAGMTGNICEDLRTAVPSTRTQRVGPQNVSIRTRVTPLQGVVKSAPATDSRPLDSAAGITSITHPTRLVRDQSAAALHAGLRVDVSFPVSVRLTFRKEQRQRQDVRRPWRCAFRLLTRAAGSHPVGWRHPLPGSPRHHVRGVCCPGIVPLAFGRFLCRETASHPVRPIPLWECSRAP